jgi:hypothetical protein
MSTDHEEPSIRQVFGSSKRRKWRVLCDCIRSWALDHMRVVEWAVEVNLELVVEWYMDME